MGCRFVMRRKPAMSAHILGDDDSHHRILRSASQLLADKYRITHSTIQVHSLTLRASRLILDLTHTSCIVLAQSARWRLRCISLSAAEVRSLSLNCDQGRGPYWSDRYSACIVAVDERYRIRLRAACAR